MNLGWAFLTLWESVGHITSEPLVNWFSFSDLETCSPTPSYPSTISFCHFLYTSLSICTSCPEDASYLHVRTVWEVYVFILLIWVTRQSITSGDRTFPCPQWQDWESSGFKQERRATVEERRHWNARGDFQCVFVCDNACMLLGVSGWNVWLR